MLSSRALDFYYHIISSTREITLAKTIELIKTQFETHKIQQSYLQKWNAIRLLTFITDNPGKTKQECFDIMLNKLHKIQPELTSNYQGEETMRYQVLLAAAGVPDCWITLYNPAPTLAGVCSNIQQAFVTFVTNQATFAQENSSNSNSNSLYTQF